MKNKLFISFISYYILILLIPGMVILSLCVSGTIIIKNEAIEANRIIIETLSNDVDNKLTSLEEFSIMLQSDSELTTLLHNFQDFTAENRYDLSSKLLELNVSLGVNSDIENFLFYMSADDYLVYSSGYSSMTDLNEYLFQTFFADIPDFQLLLENELPTLFTIYSDNTSQIFYTASLHKNYNFSSSDQLILQVNYNNFIDLIAETQSEDSIAFFILDNTNNEVLYTNNTALIPTVDFTSIDYDNFVSINETNDYYAYKKNSIQQNLSYVALVSSEEINTSLNILYLILIVSLLIMIVSTIFMLRFIKRKRYLPLYHTMSMFDISDKNIINSYEFLKDNVSKLVVEKDNLQENFENSKEYLQNYFILRTLTETISDATEYKKLLDYYHIDFNYKSFRVLTFYKNTEKLSEYDNQVICKIMDGFLLAFEEQTNTYAIYINNMYTIIMNYDPITAPSNKMLETLYFHKESLIEQDIILALSRKKSSFLELNTAYNESLQAIEQCLVDGTNVKEYQEYIRNKNTDDLKYYNYEQSFRLTVQEHNIEKSKLVLSNIFTILRKEYGSNPTIIRYKLYALLNILMSEFVKNNDNDAIKEIYQGMENTSNIEELIFYLYTVLELTIPVLLKTENKDNDFVIEIEEFILKNVYKNELSVGQIAYEFNIDMSILSKKFKKEKGINISDYIHELRIKKAKELLANDSYRIREIAEECGYLNADTFIRVFKRYEGITPGKYRESKK